MSSLILKKLKNTKILSLIGALLILQISALLKTEPVPQSSLEELTQKTLDHISEQEENLTIQKLPNGLTVLYFFKPDTKWIKRLLRM